VITICRSAAGAWRATAERTRDEGQPGAPRRAGQQIASHADGAVGDREECVVFSSAG
jgi:hypothetical protein